MFRTGVISRIAHRSVDFNALSRKLNDPKARAALETLRTSYGEIEQDARTYLKDAEPIDFAAFREKIKTPGIVNTFETEYKNIKFPEIDPSEFASTSHSGKQAELLAEAQAQLESAKARMAELSETIELMEATRSTAATTIEEVEQLYPELVEEIDDEIANYQWNKDV